jgi:hypothetical protein
MRACLAVLWLCLASLGWGTAAANPSSVETDGRAQRLLQCLLPARGAVSDVDYPEELLRRHDDGIVRVRLEFDRPDQPPAIAVLFSTAVELTDVVRRRLYAYRLPCLPRGEQPVVAVQEFVFDPGDGRAKFRSMPLSIQDTDENCRLVQSQVPVTYTAEAAARGEEGNVVVRSVYARPGPPSEVTVLNRIGSRSLERTARDAAMRDDVECRDAGAREWPLRAVRSFSFRMEGSADKVFNALSLRDFLGHVKDLASHRVRFDLTTMGCPFEVDVSVFQPYAANGVGVVGAHDPNRSGFLSWLKELSLRIPPETEKFVVGRTIRVSVPCGVLDLAS